MRCSLLTLAAAVATASIPPNGQPDLVNVDTGTVMGVRIPSEGLRYFLGIPYADTTAGANAWMPPQPRTPWNGTFDATELGPGCYSIDHNPDTATNQSYDCLNVNVYAPVVPAGTRLPVMVFIYGGAFREGWNAGPFDIYSGAYMVTTHQVVTVALNYRVGAMGFLVTDSLRGNYGLMDQRAALQWVQRNIALFGGDPTQVTVWGESAGAMSIGVHLTAPKSQGLFTKAIMESNVGAYDYKNVSQAAVYGFTFCQLLNCTASSGSTCDTGCLRATTPQAIVKAWQDASTNAIDFIIADWGHLLDGFLQFTPVVDGDEVPVEPQEALASGNYWGKGIPLLLGTNTNEGETFIYDTVTDPLPGFLVDLAFDLIFGGENASFIAQQPRYNTSVPDGRTPLSNAITDYWFRCGSERFAAAAYTAGAPAWVYRFDHVFSKAFIFPEFGLPAVCGQLVCHASELPFVYHNDVPAVNATFTPAEAAFSASMSAFWASFAKTGNPNTVANQTMAMPQWDPTGRNNIVFNISMTVESSAPMCTGVWDKLGYFF